MPGIDGLAGKLARLCFRLEHVSVASAAVACASYPGGARPSSTVTLTGSSHEGRGEHVGWTDAEHHDFANASSRLSAGTFTLDDWSRAVAALPPYDRAALEAAAVDLALKQNGTNLFELAGIDPRPVRYAVSFARVSDPVAEARTLETGELPLKIDADPDWPEDTWIALARLGTVAVVDFKLGGCPDDHDRACRHLPNAWLEDPRPAAAAWMPRVARRLSADAAVTSAAALDALDPRPAAVNVKPARMGGVLEALRCIERAARLGIEAYVGGMFEVGIGRTQLLALAAITSPDGANDIAPLLMNAPRPLRLRVDADASGFGELPA